MKRLRITRRALEEMKAAQAWHSERDADAAARLMVAIDAVVDRLTMLPGVGSPWPGVPELRRVMVSGFPYWVVYEEDPSAVVVVALAHHSRRPLYWLTP